MSLADVVDTPARELSSEVTIGLEPFDVFYPDGKELLYKHWREIAHYDDIPLDVDEEAYRRVEQSGMLRIFVARQGGKIVGYAVFIVRYNPHYMGSLQANEDVIYVDPACRRSTIGLRLIRHCDEALAAEGVQVAFHHVKRAHPTLGTILQRRGYEIVDIIYAKRLDRIGGN